MDGEPKAFARAVARVLDSGSVPAGPAQPAAPSKDPWGPWVNWSEQIVATLAENDKAFAAINDIFEFQEQRIDALEARLAELEKRPAARSVEHMRDSSGAVIRSVVVDGNG